MKKFYERILGDKIAFPEEYRTGELAFMNVSADRGNIFMKEFGDLPGGVEVDFGSHFSPMNFLILYRVLSWGFGVLPLRISAIAECDILRNIAIRWRVRSLSKTNSLNLAIKGLISVSCMAITIIWHKVQMSRLFFNYFRFLFF